MVVVAFNQSFLLTKTLSSQSYWSDGCGVSTLSLSFSLSNKTTDTLSNFVALAFVRHYHLVFVC